VRNVVEHAQATRVVVRVDERDGFVRLTVTDDGVGFRPEAVRDAPSAGHFGLRMLGDLAEEAGGPMTIRSAPGSGATISAELPVA
jgi:signal transduction histidine kinase